MEVLKYWVYTEKDSSLRKKSALPWNITHLTVAVTKTIDSQLQGHIVARLALSSVKNIETFEETDLIQC